MGKLEISKKNKLHTRLHRQVQDRACRPLQGHCHHCTECAWSDAGGLGVGQKPPCRYPRFLPANIHISSLVPYISASLILGIFSGNSCQISVQLLIQSLFLIPKRRPGSQGKNKANPFPGIFTRVRTQAPPCSYPAAPNIQLGRIPLPSVGKPSELADKQVWPTGNKQ